MMGTGKGWRLLVVGCLAVWGILLALFAGYGYEKTWRLWGVPALMPPFYDFRVVPGMVETLHMGLDPRVENPGDPAGRPFNLPSIWYLLAYTGLSQDDTLWLGTASVLLFFASAFTVFKDIAPREALFILLILFSPAAMLLYERGNVDLLVFALCASAVAQMENRAGLSAALILLAALLKLYPVLGLAGLVFKGRRQFLLLSLLTLVPLAMYMLLTGRNTQAAWSLTQRSAEISYGAQVLYMQFFRGGEARLGGLLFNLAALILLVGSAWSGRRLAAGGRYLKAFWVGAGVYAGTFLIGTNWDYRLVFLVLTVPQLVEWAKADSGMRFPARAGLILALLSCWGLLLNTLLSRPGLEAAYGTFFLLDEAANWVLFAGLVHLMTASVPEWVRQDLRILFDRQKLNPNGRALQ